MTDVLAGRLLRRLEKLPGVNIKHFYAYFKSLDGIFPLLKTHGRVTTLILYFTEFVFFVSTTLR